MPDTARDLIKQTISNTPGAAGSLTLSTASTGYLALGASDDGKTFTVLISASDSDTAAKEMRSGCTYTHSTTTLTRGTLVAGTAIDLTSSAVVSVVMQADSGRRWDAAALEHSTVTGTSGAISAAVNTLYVADMSGWTADRTLTLPATAAVGDRVGVMVSVGDDAYEWLITAASGDTLNAVAGGTEWSRVFITGEVVVMRCVTANTTWVVEQDCRVPCAYSVYLTTSAAGETAGTWTDPVSKSGVWTVEVNNGSCGSNSKFTARRGGTFSVGLRGRNSTQHTAQGQYYGVAAFEADLTTYQVYAIFNSPGTTLLTAPASNGITALAAGGEINYRYTSQDGSRGLASFASAAYTAFSVVEVL